MTEKEKMLSGAPYDASCPELRNIFHKAKEFIAKYNATATHDEKLRCEMLKGFLGAAGESPYIEPPFYCDYGQNIHFGDMVYLNCNCVFLDCAKITIGSRVLFAPNVHIYTAHHPLNGKKRVISNANGERKIVDLASPVTIGNDVWIGGNVTILPGITIGDNVVIGAGSVVTKNIPSNTVAAGNPCKVIKHL